MDPLGCLRSATICIAVWNIIYCLIQFGILGWQAHVVKEIQYDYEGRQLPRTGFIDGFQENFPGLYNIYVETPERRRANAMYVIVFVCLIFAIANLLTSCVLLYAAIRYQKALVLPWFATSVPLCIMTTVYSVLWWSGNEIFNAQLTMSIFEFVMSVVVNSLTIIVVVVFYARLAGAFRAAHRPAHRRKHHVERIYVTPRERRSRRHEKSTVTHLDPNLCPTPYPAATVTPGVQYQVPYPAAIGQVPYPGHGHNPVGQPLYTNAVPPTSMGLDFYAPEVDDKGFPWKLKRLEDARNDRKLSQADRIAQLYYQQYPESLSDVPAATRRKMRLEREAAERRQNKRRADDDDSLL